MNPRHADYDSQWVAGIIGFFCELFPAPPPSYRGTNPDGVNRIGSERAGHLTQNGGNDAPNAQSYRHPESCYNPTSLALSFASRVSITKFLPCCVLMSSRVTAIYVCLQLLIGSRANPRSGIHHRLAVATHDELMRDRQLNGNIWSGLIPSLFGKN